MLRDLYHYFKYNLKNIFRLNNATNYYSMDCKWWNQFSTVQIYAYAIRLSNVEQELYQRALNNGELFDNVYDRSIELNKNFIQEFLRGQIRHK